MSTLNRMLTKFSIVSLLFVTLLVLLPKLVMAAPTPTTDKTSTPTTTQTTNTTQSTTKTPAQAAAKASATGEVIDESGQSGFVICGNTVDTPCNITHLFKAMEIIINYLISVAGLVAIMFIVIAGVRMIASRGEGDLTVAKKNLTNAIIGLILVAIAYVAINSLFSGKLSIGVKCGESVLLNPSAYVNCSE